MSASVCGKELRYFQEVAVSRVLERVVKGQRRILLTMATGTGKTFTAFQVVWKLKKSGWLRKPVLFLADRIVLRDQAYNNFAPFVDEQSDSRSIIRGGKWNRNRDLYFALYQALDSDEAAAPLYTVRPWSRGSARDAPLRGGPDYLTPALTLGSSTSTGSHFCVRLAGDSEHGPFGAA